MSTVLASSADVVKFWSTGGEDAQPVLKSVVPLPCDSVQQISWNHNNELLAACGTESTVGLISEAGQLLVQLPFDPQDTAQRMNGFISALCFSKTSRYLCTAGEDLDIMLWHLRRRELIGKLVGMTSLASSLQFFRTEDQLLSADLGGHVVVWNVREGRQAHVLLHPTAPKQSAVHGCKISPFSQNAVASVYGDGTCCLWDVATASCSAVLPEPHTGMAWALAFSPTNKNLIATGGEDGLVKFFDINSHRFIRAVRGEASVSAVDFHPNGTSVALGTVEGTILQYDLRNPIQPVFTLNAHHPHRITCLAYQKALSRHSVKTAIQPVNTTTERPAAPAASAAGSETASTAAEPHSPRRPVSPKGPGSPPARLMKSQTEAHIARDDPRRLSFSSQPSDGSVNSRPLGSMPSLSSISSASMTHIESRYSNRYLSQEQTAKSPRRPADSQAAAAVTGTPPQARSPAEQAAIDAQLMPPPRTPPTNSNSNGATGSGGRSGNDDSAKSDLGALVEQLRQRSESVSSQLSALQAEPPASLSRNSSFAVADFTSDKIRTAIESVSRPTSERFSLRGGDIGRSAPSSGPRDYAARFEAAAAASARGEEDGEEANRTRQSIRAQSSNSSTIVHDAQQLMQPVSSRMLHEQLQTLRYDMHRDMQTVIKEITRQFETQQDEIMTMFAGFDKRLQELAEENHKLREENEKLRNMF